MSIIYDGPVRITTASFVRPNHACENCDYEESQRDEDTGELFLTVAVPKQFGVSLGDQVTLKVECPEAGAQQ